MLVTHTHTRERACEWGWRQWGRKHTCSVVDINPARRVWRGRRLGKKLIKMCQVAFVQANFNWLTLQFSFDRAIVLFIYTDDEHAFIGSDNCYCMPAQLCTSQHMGKSEAPFTIHRPPKPMISTSLFRLGWMSMGAALTFSMWSTAPPVKMCPGMIVRFTGTRFAHRSCSSFLFRAVCGWPLNELIWTVLGHRAG